MSVIAEIRFQPCENKMLFRGYKVFRCCHDILLGADVSALKIYFLVPYSMIFLGYFSIKSVYSIALPCPIAKIV